jgi:hypothetical protein
MEFTRYEVVEDNYGIPGEYPEQAICVGSAPVSAWHSRLAKP